MTNPLPSDLRGWATLGVFLMALYVLTLTALRPELAQNEFFKTIATLIMGNGGLGLVFSYLWGGSKATTSAIDTVNQMAARSPQPSAQETKT